MEPTLCRNRVELGAYLAQTDGKRGLVMTMGALHEGHLDLARRARETSDHVVVSIFVNPLQFAPGEDLDAYPRDLEGDMAKLAQVGVDAVYAPTPSEIYPHGQPQVIFNPGPIAQTLEGATRPTHFAGVLQIVAKVFNMVRPDLAFFGQKDAQQLALIRQLVRDLDYGIEIVAVPIRRDTDAVALSSRNAYLSPLERQQARALNTALREGDTVAQNSGTAQEVLAAASNYLNTSPGVEVDYVALVDPLTFIPVQAVTRATTAALLVAAKVGKTRLIDNILVTLKP